MACPKMDGKIVRDIYLHHQSRGKNKEYRIVVTVDEHSFFRVYTEYGPAGNLRQGREASKKPLYEWEADNLANRIARGKLSQADAYSLVSDTNKTIPPVIPPPPTESTPMYSGTLSAAAQAALSALF